MVKKIGMIFIGSLAAIFFLGGGCMLSISTGMNPNRLLQAKNPLSQKNQLQNRIRMLRLKG